MFSRHGLFSAYDMDRLNLLPAILVGGPPHSGKSVLAYSLSQALRTRKVAHYLLRAAPDGEGDWAQEMDWRWVQAIRFKGAWDEHWVRVVCRDLAARIMPLLVDIGGKPTAEQMAIFDQCTGAILLTPNEEAARAWRAMVTERGLPVIADLRSVRTGESMLWHDEDGALRGCLSELERGKLAEGIAFEALVKRLERLFAFSEDELARTHLQAAPKDAHVVLIRAISSGADRIAEEELEAIVARVPSGQPIALYGRMPVWLATALSARREVRWQFDARLGWVRTPTFVMARPGEPLPEVQAGLRFALREVSAGVVQLDVSREVYYLDYEAMDGVRVPYVAPSARVRINGPQVAGGGLPLWVFAALGRAYRGCAEVRALQAQAEPADV